VPLAIALARLHDFLLVDLHKPLALGGRSGEQSVIGTFAQDLKELLSFKETLEPNLHVALLRKSQNLNHHLLQKGQSAASSRRGIPGLGAGIGAQIVLWRRKWVGRGRPKAVLGDYGTAFEIARKKYKKAKASLIRAGSSRKHRRA
jgi:hypothetical protein